MNTNLKPTLWAIFAALAMMIWLKWEAANAPQLSPVSQSETVQTGTATVATNSTANNNAGVPGNAPPPIPSDSNDIANSPQNTARLVNIKTDVLDVTIDTVGGTIVESQLLKYSTSIDDPTPIQLFSSEPGQLFHFETGVNAPTHKANATHKATFTAAKNQYQLSGDSIAVPLTWQADGVTVSKTFTFYRGRYDFSVEQRIDNNSQTTWNGYQYSQLQQNEVVIERGLTTFNTFAGGVYSTPENRYNKVSFAELGDSPLQIANVNGGWVGMMEHYFMGAIIPPQEQSDTFFSKRTGTSIYTIGMYSQSASVAVGNSATFSTTGFVGPKIKDDLARVAPDLDKATDYGWFFFISEFLFNVLDWVHSVVKNWGWAIVIVTLGIKTILFPLAAKSFKSMAKMRKFQPEMERIRENYGDDRQQVGKKMMELYKKEGINPASGCLPILVQIPIFLAFYYMLMESVELRQAPWIFWIKDLSVQDPYFVLPIINMGLMFVQQRLNPPPSDPMQRKVMMFLPLVFGFLFLVFPAGLVLYWAVSNLFSIIQQYVITKRYGGLANPLSHTDEKPHSLKK